MVVLQMLIDDIKSKTIHRPKVCTVFLPVAATFPSDQESISANCKQFLPRYFYMKDSDSTPVVPVPDPCTFGIVYRTGCNAHLKKNRLETIQTIASVIDQSKHPVKLDAPTWTIMIIVLKSVVTLSIIRDMHALKKLNLQEMEV